VRQQIPLHHRTLAADALHGHICAIPDWPGIRRVAGYLAANAEIDPAPLLAQLHAAGKALYLPVIREDNSLHFAPWAPGDELVNNRYGIGEPTAATGLCEAGELDAVLLPLVGWTRRGQRLGMGGGFYDRSLAGVSGVLKVGLAFAAQELAGLPAEPWDIDLDFVATEQALVDCRA